MIVSRVEFEVFSQKHEVLAPCHICVKEMTSIKSFVQSFYETAHITNVEQVEVSDADYEAHNYESGKPLKVK